MKRFIRYLYEYEQDKRLRNVGFVKAEQGDRECVLHIHGKGLNLQEEKSLRVYLFFTEEGACFGIWQGDAQNVNPAINYRLYYTDQDVGGKEQFARIGGVILEAAGGRKFAAVWDDEAVNIGGMRVYTEERREQEIPAGEEADEQEIPERRRSGCAGAGYGSGGSGSPGRIPLYQDPEKGSGQTAQMRVEAVQQQFSASRLL